MNYYYRFPGDYARDTQDLSLAEHGAYALLLDFLYGTQQVLPKNPLGLYRVCKAFTDEEKLAVDKIIKRFFIETEVGYTNLRAEKEIERARSRIDAARVNGAKGGRGRKSVKTETKELTQWVSSGLPSGVPDGVPSGVALQSPIYDVSSQYSTSSHTSTQESASQIPDGKAEKIPYQRIVEAYNEVLGDRLPKAQLLTEARKRSISVRWKETLGSMTPNGQVRFSDAETGVEWFKRFFGKVKTNSHWTGDNDRGWTADLDWIFKPANFQKILEYRPSDPEVRK